MIADNDAEIEEEWRNIELGMKLIESNSRDFLLIYATKDGTFGYATSNRTWATGATIRVRESLDERERIDTRRIEQNNESSE